MPLRGPKGQHTCFRNKSLNIITPNLGGEWSLHCKTDSHPDGVEVNYILMRQCNSQVPFACAMLCTTAPD